MHMEDFFCCPKCGSKALHSSYEQLSSSMFKSEETKYWLCANCGNEFVDLSYYNTKIDYYESRAKKCIPLCNVVGFTVAIILFFAVSANSAFIGIVFGLFIWAVFFGIGCYGKHVNELASSKIEEELHSIKAQMCRFKKN